MAQWFLLSMGLAKALLIGTDAVIGFAVLIAKTATFGSLDQLSAELIMMGVLMGICTYPGTLLARWILERTSLTLHIRLIEILILLTGASFLVQGVWQWLM